MSTDSLKARAMAILSSALGQPFAERGAWIRKQCHDNSALDDRVIELLAVDGASDGTRNRNIVVMFTGTYRLFATKLYPTLYPICISLFEEIWFDPRSTRRTTFRNILAVIRPIEAKPFQLSCRGND